MSSEFGLSVNVTPLRATDCVAISDLAEALNLPPSALIAAIEKNRQAINKPFYSISDLAGRWNCSRATIYNILRDADFKALNIASKTSEERQSWRIPASVVEKIEQSRLEHLPEVAA